MLTWCLRLCVHSVHVCMFVCMCVCGTLKVRVCKRLGARRGRWLDVRCHSFFAGKIDIEQANQQNMSPPWLPDIEELTDAAKAHVEDAYLQYTSESPPKMVRKASISSQPEGPPPSLWDEVF